MKCLFDLFLKMLNRFGQIKTGEYRREARQLVKDMSILHCT